MPRHGPLGEFEQLLLLAVLQLEEEAYGPEISRYLEESIGREVSRGSLYSSLSRLGEKGFLVWEIESATMDEGGSGKRKFEVTPEGIDALRANRAALLTLWSGIESKLERQGS